MAGLSLTIYGLFLNQLSFMQHGGSQGMANMALTFATIIPAYGAALLMMQRLPRMAQELLRPATRSEYLDGLLLALAKQTGWLWLAMQVGLLAMAFATNAFPDENLLSLAVPYLLISLAAQIPAFGMSLWLARKGSMRQIALGFCGVAIFQMAAIGAWWSSHEEWWGPLVAGLAIALLLALGMKTIAWTRHAWQQLELG